MTPCQAVPVHVWPWINMHMQYNPSPEIIKVHTQYMCALLMQSVSGTACLQPDM